MSEDPDCIDGYTIGVEWVTNSEPDDGDASWEAGWANCDITHGDNYSSSLPFIDDHGLIRGPDPGQWKLVPRPTIEKLIARARALGAWND